MGASMKLQFKHQRFQADAAKAVVDVFAGQPYLTPTYMMDRGYGQIRVEEEREYTGWSNQRIIPDLSDQRILENLQKVQRANQIAPSAKLEGRADGFNLTIEMETGVGKTYTYIKTEISFSVFTNKSITRPEKEKNLEFVTRLVTHIRKIPENTRFSGIWWSNLS